MSVTTVQKFSDFAEEDINLSGDKLQMREIFNKAIIVKNFRVMESKAVPGKDCAQLQIELDGKEYVVFTTSVVLLRQLQQYKDKLPFSTVVKNMRKYHTFT